MSGASSNAAEWSSRLEPARRGEDVFRRPDDPRLGEVIPSWNGDLSALTPGRAVVIGFPQDEGVRRNHGRDGAAAAPHEIRQKLFRLTPYDASAQVDLSTTPPLDLGDVRIQGNLEETQQGLGAVVAGVLEQGAVPIVLGGGHETAFGHYLGYAALRRKVAIINIDAHLDVRPFTDNRGHSGSSFRQAMEHAEHPLPGPNYVCLGAQPSAVARDHLNYVRGRGGVVYWRDEVCTSLEEVFQSEHDRLTRKRCQLLVTLDADAVAAAEVPAVSSPNPLGLAGHLVAALARRAGILPAVSSFELVEINPRLDHDGQSSRFAAVVLWHFLIGLAMRSRADSA